MAVPQKKKKKKEIKKEKKNPNYNSYATLQLQRTKSTYHREN